MSSIITIYSHVSYLQYTLFFFSLQRKVYDDVGQTVLNNAWEGYNSTLFAYGQTGSGKSWSIVGYGVNKGNSIKLARKHAIFVLIHFTLVVV